MTNAAKDFSKADRAALKSRGIVVAGSTWLPSAAGDFANGERGYILHDNGCQRIRTYAQVRAIAAGGPAEFGVGDIA